MTIRGIIGITALAPYIIGASLVLTTACAPKSRYRGPVKLPGAIDNNKPVPAPGPTGAGGGSSTPGSSGSGQAESSVFNDGLEGSKTGSVDDSTVDDTKKTEAAIQEVSTQITDDKPATETLKLATKIVKMDVDLDSAIDGQRTVKATLMVENEDGSQSILNFEGNAAQVEGDVKFDTVQKLAIVPANAENPSQIEIAAVCAGVGCQTVVIGVKQGENSTAYAISEVRAKAASSAIVTEGLSGDALIKANKLNELLAGVNEVVMSQVYSVSKKVSEVTIIASVGSNPKALRVVGTLSQGETLRVFESSNTLKKGTVLEVTDGQVIRIGLESEADANGVILSTVLVLGEEPAAAEVKTAGADEVKAESEEAKSAAAEGSTEGTQAEDGKSDSAAAEGRDDSKKEDAKAESEVDAKDAEAVVVDEAPAADPSKAVRI